MRKNPTLTTIFDVHKSIADTGTHNFLSAQIQLNLQLKPDVWDMYLCDYWDKQLPFLITYGFPLDFIQDSPLMHEEINHPSATLFNNDVQHYLQEEVNYGAILGPFEDIEHR